MKHEIQFKFNKNKTLQALNFFAKKEGGKISRLKALKLLFFVDKFLIRTKGKLLTGDVYKALEKGPVADKTSLLFNNQEDVIFLEQNSITSLADVKLEVFSNTDEKVMTMIWDRFGKMNENEIWNHTHSHPEWQQHAEHFENNINRKTIKYEDFLENSDADKDFFPDLSEAKKNAILEILEENSLAEKAFS